MAHKSIQETKRSDLCECGQKGYNHNFLHCPVCAKVINPINCICKGCEKNCNAKIFRIEGTENSVRHQYPNENFSVSIRLDRPKQAKERIQSSKKVKTNNQNSKNANNVEIESIGDKITNFASSMPITVLCYNEDIEKSQQNKNKRSIDEDIFEDADSLLNETWNLDDEMDFLLKINLVIDDDNNENDIH